MNDLTDKQQDVRYIKPPNLFKQKVGSGGIPQDRLEKGQTLINTTKTDIKPYAEKFLLQFSTAMETADTKDFRDIKDDIAMPIMQIKANGGMFQYQLLSDVAAIALNFLESVSDFNRDVEKVLTAHQNTIQVILTNEMKGAGGKEGDILIMELNKACKRYFDKHPMDKITGKKRKS